jgi:hypothetical protein
MTKKYLAAIATSILTLIIIAVISCNKNDQKKQDANKQGTITGWHLSKNNTKEKPLDSVKGTSNSNRESKVQSFGCGSSLSGDYYTNGYYRYPDNTLDFSSSPVGTLISVTVQSYDVPDRFTIKDPSGNVVASTGWMGYVNYSGPWGMSLNTQETQYLSFTIAAAGAYTLIVETVVNGYSDSWLATVGCTIPADITSFLTSPEYSEFSNTNSTITAKMTQGNAVVRSNYNSVDQENLKTITLPVVQYAGDTSGLIIGIPQTDSFGTHYSIIYADLTQLIRGTDYYNGSIGADLYNSSATYTVYVTNSRKTGDTLFTGPRYITNYACNGCRWVWPSWGCISTTRKNFMNYCNNNASCETACELSNIVAASCLLGTLSGATVWCARHNNSAGTYGARIAYKNP